MIRGTSKGARWEAYLCTLIQATMFFAIGSALAFFFDLLLLSKRRKSLADKVLAVWLAVLGVHLLLYYAQWSGLNEQYPHLIGLILPLPFVHPPLLYLYTAALTGELRRWRPRLLPHFLPVFIIYGYYAEFFLSSAPQKRAFMERVMGEGPDLFMRAMVPAMVLVAVAYLPPTLRLFRRHHRRLLDNFSFTNEKIDLLWLQVLIIGLTSVWVVVFVTNFLIEGFESDVPIYVAVVLFVVAMGFFGVRQGNIFTPQAVVVAEAGDDNGARYAKSGLKEVEAAQVQAALTRLMETEHLYEDETLSLPKLAERLDIHPNYLSQVINERLGKNFYDFVNGYRVAAFQRLIAQGEQRRKTFLALALECGFASKASFNKAFRKFTGQTPSEYARSLKEG